MNTEYRSILVLTGEQSACLDYCHDYLDNRPALWISQLKQNNEPTISHRQANTQLGQENTIIVFDATEYFDANALGVISGTIIGGGLLILLLPDSQVHYPNAVFLKRLLQILKQQNIPVYPVSEQGIPLPHSDSVSTTGAGSDSEGYCVHSVTPTGATPPSHKVSSQTPSEITLTTDQQNAVDAVIKVAKGRRKRPLVLTADRGRGKSTALGVAAKRLLELNALLALGVPRIVVCAPAKAMVKPLLQQLSKQTEVLYFAPDELDRLRPEAEIVIIDEAGAIPVPLLTRLLKHYSRMVFSTTLQGYEGNGKGFAIRFQKQLDKITPGWSTLKLEGPIRWGQHDPLEDLINKLLLLNAEPSVPRFSSPLQIEDIEHQQLDGRELATNEAQLRQLFGLLVIAHYQTRPSDLLQLLDSPDISIHVLSDENAIIAAAIVSHEGGFDSDMSQQIYEGKRRPKGNLVPQVLTFQLGIPKAAELQTDRIMRIAVHPDCQRLQLGSHLLSLIHQRSTADYLSSSFGMSNDLLHFWESSAYRTVHLGLKREASSGYHSAVMLRPLTPNGEALLQESQVAFKRHFCAQLADALNDYESEIVINLLVSESPSSPPDLSAQEARDIERFAKGFSGYDLAMSALLRWLPNALAANHSRINKTDAALLVMRVLQHHDWAYCCKVLGLKGKQQALSNMQQTVAKLLNPAIEKQPSIEASK